MSPAADGGRAGVVGAAGDDAAPEREQGGRVAVVGSANLDLVVRVERHPAPGETLLGSDYQRHAGGKGANQAVAAARLGAPVAFVGCVGGDEFGELLSASLTEAGVDVAAVEKVTRPTGVAFIQVDAKGENTIVVAPGANAELTPQRVTRALEASASSPGAGFDVLCLQLEVPLASVLAAAKTARAAGALVLLNLAPPLPLDAEQLRDVTHLLVNEHEAASLLGSPSEQVALDPEAAAAELTSLVPNVVITLGEQGAAWAQRGDAASDEPGVVEAGRGRDAGQARSGRAPAFAVAAVDTTAAGDAFAGALATRLCAGTAAWDLAGAVRYACAAAALATTRHGAQPSLPSEREVASLLERS